jgi:hypothetical protein
LIKTVCRQIVFRVKGHNVAGREREARSEMIIIRNIRETAIKREGRERL